MSEESEKKADIIRDAVKDARDILNQPLDLGDLPIPKEKAFLDEYGRFDENWAGQLFTRSYLNEEIVREVIEPIDGWDEVFVPRSKDELRPTPEHRVVPLVYYRDGIIDDAHRVKIGTAKVYPDGSFKANLGNDVVLEDRGGLVGPVDGTYSVGRSVNIDTVVEVNIDGDEDKISLLPDLVLDDIKESDL